MFAVFVVLLLLTTASVYFASCDKIYAYGIVVNTTASTMHTNNCSLLGAPLGKLAALGTNLFKRTHTSSPAEQQKTNAADYTNNWDIVYMYKQLTPQLQQFAQQCGRGNTASNLYTSYAQ